MSEVLKFNIDFEGKDDIIKVMERIDNMITEMQSIRDFIANDILLKHGAKFFEKMGQHFETQIQELDIHHK